MANKSIYGLSLTAFLALFGAVTFLFLLWPDLDLVVHRGLYDPITRTFPGQQVWLFQFLAEAVEWVVVAAVVLPLVVLVGQRLWRRGAGDGALAALSWRVYGYILASLAVGPGLVVNEMFKNHWGRARPRQIVEFGGSADFTPPWVPTDQCARNCSFTSGDASVGFWLVTLAFLLPAPWRGRAIWASVALGGLVGYARMAKGAHFFSDVLYSGLFVVLVARSLHAWLIAPECRLGSAQNIWPRPKDAASVKTIKPA